MITEDGTINNAWQIDTHYKDKEHHVIYYRYNS